MQTNWVKRASHETFCSVLLIVEIVVFVVVDSPSLPFACFTTIRDRFTEFGQINAPSLRRVMFSFVLVQKFGPKRIFIAVGAV